VVADRNVLPTRTRFHWRLTRRNKQEISICTRVALFSVAALAYAGVALAGPTGGEVVGGSGTITQSGPTTDINQASQRLDINWQTFSTGVSESVNFYQPGASAVAINRVIGGVPSQLRGALTANGRVFILNQAGVTFYSTSRVNVGALLATTAANVAIDGDSFSFSGDGYGRVVNQGNIKVSDGGFAILAAPYVSNAGVIEANLGEVRLVSANAYTLDLRGDGLITFTVDADTLDEIAAEGDALGVDNTGVLRARSGLVAITAATASKIVNAVVNLDGVVDANAFAAGKDGGTVLVASTGDLNITGEVRADGGIDGNGGQVITKADGTNTVAETATLSARGGDAAGDGGFIEVSGTHFRLGGAIDASAPNGDGGSFLLDPANVVIADGVGTGTTDTWFESEIEAMSQAGTDVTIMASNSIVMEDLADNELTGGDGDIVLETAPGTEGGVGTITFNDLNDSIVTQRGDILIEASGSNADITIGNLETGRPLGTALESTSPVSDPGLIEVIAHGPAGDIANVGNITITAKDGLGGSAVAGALLEAGGDINVNGDTLVTASGGNAFAGVAMIAGTEGAGDLSVTGEFTVTANATATPAASSDANAIAVAFLQAAGDVTVTTPSSTMRVQATATNGVENGSGAFAGAGLAVRAGNTGVPTGSSISTALGDLIDSSFGLADVRSASGGDISITGNTVVAANASVTVGAKDIGSAASGFSSDIAGDASAFAGVLYDANSGSLSEAAAAGNVTVTGNTTVDADATITVADLAVHDIMVENTTFTAFEGMVAGDAIADASFSIDADGGVTINSDVTVTADAHITVGNIAITNILVSASYDEFASFTGFSDNVVGLASADAAFNIDARGAVNIGTGGGGTVTAAANATVDVGTITVSGTASASSDNDSSATAEFTAFDSHVASSARANASIDISSAAGGVTVGDAIVVDANAGVSVGDISIDGRATAFDSSSGTYDGAFASFVGFDNALAHSAEADANLNINNAGTAVNLTGGVTVGADATLSVGNVAIDGTARASASSEGTAEAYFYGFADNVFDDTAGADATVTINDNAGAVTIAGGLAVDATAASNAGDVAITGIADAIIKGDSSGSSASASFYGIDGDFFAGSADAHAGASLSRNSGVDVTGGLAVGANTDITVGAVAITGSAFADAGSPSSARADADFIGIDDDILESGDASARVDINSNRGDVTLDGVTATATTDITVGDITIRGGRTVSTEGGSSFVRGGAIARTEGSQASADFTGIDDDVLDSGEATAFVSIMRTDGNVAINGDVNVAGALDISIGEISLDAKASALANGSSAWADARVEGIDNSVLDHGASASGGLSINSTLASEGATGDAGNVTITGNVDVTGEGAVTVGGFTADVDVIASAQSGNASASASFVADNVFDDEASGDGWINFYGNRGDVTVEGDINVVGAMQVNAGDITVTGDVAANVLDDGYARADFTVFGSEFFDSSADAEASVNITNTYGDVSLGGVTVNADGRLVIGDINVTGSVAATGDRGGTASADMTIFRDEAFEDDASAEAGLNISFATPRDLTIDGPVDVGARGHMTVGDITVAGDVAAKAGKNQFTEARTDVDAGFTLFSNAIMSSEADASAQVSIYGANNATLNGGVTLLGEGLMTVGDIALDASARASAAGRGMNDANADFTAFNSEVFDPWDDIDATARLSVHNLRGDLTVNGPVSGRAVADMGIGNITLDGDAIAIVRGGTGSSSTDAPNARAEITGVNDNVFGDDAMIEAYANVGVYSVKGDVTFNNGITLDAAGTRRIGDIAVSGKALADADGFSVSAAASVTGFDYEIFDEPDEDSSAEARVSISGIGSGDSGTADVTINGGVALSATHRNQVGDISITGTASADSDANRGQANAYFTGAGSEVFYSYEGMASAELSINTVYGDVNLNGNIAIAATEALSVGDIAIDGKAISSVGDATDPVAFASFTGIDDEVMDLDSASADASIYISNVHGDVNRNGATTVDGIARIGAGSISVLGLASTEGSIGSGRASAYVYGLNSSVLYGTDADASASIYVSGVRGDVNWNGGITVTGDALQSVGDVTVDGQVFVDNDASTARASFFGINGDLISSEASADADLYMRVDGNINLTGDIAVSAIARNQVGDVTVSSSVDIASGTSFSGGFTGIDDRLIDRADARADVDIMAGVSEGPGNVNIAGDVAVLADAVARTGTVTGFDGWSAGGSADADATLDILAGQTYAGAGNIDIAGNVTVDALATVSRDGESNGGTATATARGNIDAANDVTIGPKPEDFFHGNDVAARAIADTDGSYASANADLMIEAGEATESGSVARSFVSEGDGYGGYGGEIVLSDGNLSIKADILSFASANAAGVVMDEGGSDSGGEQKFYKSFGGVSANANLGLYAHGEPSEFGNLTNEYYTHEPQAIARVNGGMEAFVNATQADLDATVANDEDGSPFTYWDGTGSEYTWAEITVHWHGEGKIFQMPMPEGGGEGIDPYILIKEKPIPPETGNAITTAGALALLPGGASCNFGTGGFTIDPDGSVLFGQFVVDIDPGDLDLAACDDNVRYPIFTDQTL